MFSFSKGIKAPAAIVMPQKITANVATLSLNSNPENTISSKSAPETDIRTSSKPLETESPNAFTTDSNEIKQVEQRLNENKNRLKKYYGTVEQLNQSKIDVAFLFLAKKIWLTNAKSNEEKLLGQKAATLLPQVAQQARELYASSIEHIFVKNGMDVKAKALGKEKKQLRIVYALMSQPLVYKFQNEIKLNEQATAVGFSKLVYTNGFESELGQTWTVDL